MRRPHALPAIERIEIPSLSVTSGETVRASVYTTSNTASVEARLYGYAMELQHVGVGHFRFVYQVPEITDFFETRLAGPNYRTQCRREERYEDVDGHGALETRSDDTSFIA